VQAISINDALRALTAAQARAQELGVQASIVIVDSGGNVKALARMDGAPFLTNTIARSKAVTAAGIGIATGDFADAVAASPALLAGFSNQDVALLPGGVPLTVDGVIAGAVGVAGGMNGEDVPIARAAQDSLIS
jgi:glc operon protein GlcG